MKQLKWYQGLTLIIVFLGLFGGYVEAASRADQFTGKWLLFVSLDGKEVPENAITVGMKIVKKDVFYNVELEIPDVEKAAAEETGDFWSTWLKKQQESTEKFGLQMVKMKYDGKYLLGDDGKSITHLNGKTTFQYRKEGKMICEENLGCFRRGDQSKLIKEYARQQAAIARAQAEAEARKPKTIINKTIVLRKGQENVEVLELDGTKKVRLDIDIKEPGTIINDRKNMARIIQLDENGYAVWQKLGNRQLKGMFDLSTNTDAKDTDSIQDGPCKGLFKREISDMQFSICTLGAGKYYYVIYDVAPISEIYPESTGEVSISFRVVTQLIEGNN